MSSFKILFAVLLGCFVALAPPGSAAQGTKLVLGYANATEFLPAFIARDKGIFERHGLDVTMTA